MHEHYFFLVLLLFKKNTLYKHHAKYHFISCIKCNANKKGGEEKFGFLMIKNIGLEKNRNFKENKK